MIKPREFLLLLKKMRAFEILEAMGLEQLGKGFDTALGFC
jgi:hypothetical protein